MNSKQAQLINLKAHYVTDIYKVISSDSFTKSLSFGAITEFLRIIGLTRPKRPKNAVSEITMMSRLLKVIDLLNISPIREERVYSSVGE